MPDARRANCPGSCIGATDLKSADAEGGAVADRCQACRSSRTAYALARCSDKWGVDLAGRRRGYVPCDLGIGGGDDIRFGYCLDCGRIRGAFPLPPSRMARGEED